MKKILTTFTVIAASVLGAQGQTTRYIPGTGTSQLEDLTFPTESISPNNPFTQARLYFGATGFDFAGGNGSIELSEITLTGQGISSTLSFDPVSITANTFYGTVIKSLSSAVKPQDPGLNEAAFKLEFKNGASAQVFGAGITYFVEYSTTVFPTEIINRQGNIGIVAVPEPSTYAAAAGLLALFLWSSRRHLLKLAGARSSASGSGENGAA